MVVASGDYVRLPCALWRFLQVGRSLGPSTLFRFQPCSASFISPGFSVHIDFISLGAEIYIARHFVRHALVCLRYLVQYFRFRTFALALFFRLSFCVISGHFSSDLYGFWPRLHHRLSICLQQFPKML